MIISQKGTDGVVIKDLPSVYNCHNQKLSKDSYKFQTLFGDQLFVLPQGSHSFLAKIMNLNTNQVEQLCTLKYRVMVHRCAPYAPQNRGLRMKCSLENLWGSTCSFTCKDGGYMNYPTNVFCNDHLEWSGEEPYCHYRGKSRSGQQMQCFNLNISPAENDNEIPLTSSCELPLPPKHGKFTCDTKSAKMSNGPLSSDRLPEGSTCRIKCHRHFEVPVHLEKYSRFSCSTNGHWNSTMMDFCIRRRTNN